LAKFLALRVKYTWVGTLLSDPCYYLTSKTDIYLSLAALQGVKDNTAVQVAPERWVPFSLLQ
jgi:hypothetical protein